ncbi:hypothetical protein OKW32_007076 [Paraburkholderia youngii]|uniref:Uncharacterized protein n=1 Tax=Paraburkholderia youngii TaxID=2782701 RepID=A0A7W8LCZ7_9BURK|nr:hypothetical protein [Paraburkholderia youngii]
MSFQLIVRGVSLSDVEHSLGLLSGRAEVFPIDPVHVGIAIPTRLFDTLGEDKIREALKHMMVYDLYSGDWSGAVVCPARRTQPGDLVSRSRH